ncbi:MAG: hypothetical protein KUG80_03495 [Gammaproteobacteria bacterium]|nr:hypothetical protein [Gammaproteobacteria bacterium]
MPKKVMFVLLAGLLAVCNFSIMAAHAKPAAPVTISYSSSDLLNGDKQLSTVIRFTAEEDLLQLVVSTSPYRNIDLLSDGEELKFVNLKRGESRELTVRVQLQANRGYLAVFASTTDLSGLERNKSIAIGYGENTRLRQLKTSADDSVKVIGEERFILMPGDERK